MKNKLTLIGLSLFLFAGALFANGISTKPVLSCKGGFYKPFGAVFGGGETVGKSSVVVYRNEAEGTIWYSAKVSAKEDPQNPGVAVDDFEFLRVVRAFYPGTKNSTAATGFSREITAGEASNAVFLVSVSDECLGGSSVRDCAAEERKTSYYAKFTYPESGEKSFSPTLTCKWSEGEGHLKFYKE